MRVPVQSFAQVVLQIGAIPCSWFLRFAHPLYGDDGNDTLVGGNGKDTLDGGAGSDTASYEGNYFGIRVALAGNQEATVLVDGAAEDTIQNIENVIGGWGDDHLIGDENGNVFHGKAGHDTFVGSLGADTYTGGTGRDTFVYQVADHTVDDVITDFKKGVDRLDLSALGKLAHAKSPTAHALWIVYEDGDTRVMGCTGDDPNIPDIDLRLKGIHLTLSDLGLSGLIRDTKVGGDGDDKLSGGTGKDTLDGGAGSDTTSYEGRRSSVRVALAGDQVATVLVDGAAEDTIQNIENVIGGWGDDHFTGDDEDNTFHGNSGNDTLIGGADKDTLDGGEGSDTASYEENYFGIRVALAGNQEATVLVDGAAEDTIQNIENVIGGDGDDHITGDDEDNTFHGNSGNDILIGRDGDDIKTGGEGADTFVYRSAEETIGDVITDFNPDEDTLDFSALGPLGFSKDGPKAKSLWTEIRDDGLHLLGDTDGNTGTTEIDLTFRSLESLGSNLAGSGSVQGASGAASDTPFWQASILG